LRSATPVLGCCDSAAYSPLTVLGGQTVAVRCVQLVTDLAEPGLGLSASISVVEGQVLDVAYVLTHPSQVFWRINQELSRRSILELADELASGASKDRSALRRATDYRVAVRQRRGEVVLEDGGDHTHPIVNLAGSWTALVTPRHVRTVCTTTDRSRRTMLACADGIADRINDQPA
jgi:hypothetical protein